MDDDDRLALLYQESTRVAALFWEWRYRLMMFFFTGIAVLLALAGWIYDHDLGRFIAAPAFVGAVLALVCALLELRNAGILRDAYRLAGEIESQWRPKGSIFAAIAAAHAGKARTTYGWIFFLGYVVAGILLLALAIVALFEPLEPAAAAVRA